MSEEISFSEKENKILSDIDISETAQLKKAAVAGIEKKQIAQQTKVEMGIVEVPKDYESVPKEVPNLFFKFGSKVIGCERFRTDDEENKIVAKHVSIIVGSQNSKIWSSIVIIIIVISKISDCWEKISSKFSKKKNEETQTNKQDEWK